MMPSELAAFVPGYDEVARASVSAKHRRTPWLSLIVGYLAMVPFACGAIATWFLDIDWSPLAQQLTVLWGCALLIFLAGARHGASFRTPGGPSLGQTAAMLWIFGLGIAALMAPGITCAVPIALLLAGYLSLAIIHPLMARRGEMLLVFERLRPIQTAIAIVSLAVLLWYVEVH